MNKILVILLLASTMVYAEWTDLGLENVHRASVEVLESTPGGMVLEITVPGVEMLQETVEGITFTHLNIPGATMSALEPGYPQVPKISFLAALPRDPSVTVTVEPCGETEVGNLIPYPMQPVTYDSATEPAPFTYSPSAYQAGVYPADHAGFKVDGTLRGVTIGRFAVNPMRWDACTGTLTVCPRMIVRVDFGGSVSADPRLYSRFFLPTYRQLLVNADVLGEPRMTSSIRSAGPVYASNIRQAREIDAADLLIIAGDDFVDTMMEAFVTAKYEQGYLPAVVAAGSWSYTEIKDYIQDAYENWTVPPSFVLMVGDGPELTAYDSPTGIWSDNRFVCVDGSDYLADIYHGRFAAPTEFYPNIESKQLKWQFDPLMDPDFWNNVLCAGMLQTYGGATAARWFLYTCETVHDTYEDIYGKTATRVYVTDATVPPPYYYHPDLPSNGEQVPSEIAFDGTKDDIINSINDGVFIIQHRDHGGVSGWADPPFYTSDLTQLSNGYRAPVVFSFNCLTGQFYQSLCFAESFARMEGGATAVIAACASSYSFFNDYMVFGCYMSFNDDYVSPPFSYTNPSGAYLAGQMMMNGKLEMHAAAPFNPYTSNWEYYSELEWDLFLVFGDPTMDMRTEVPAELDVDPPYYLPPGSSQAQFYVSTADRGAVEGALVCMRHEGDSLYATGLTDSLGSVVLEFDPIGSLNDIQWMVTAHNALPGTGSINPVGVEHGPEVQEFTAGTPFPNPGHSITFPVDLTVAGDFRLAVYDLSGRMVETLHSGELEPGSYSFTWNGSSGGRTSPSGIYLARMVTPLGREITMRVVLLR